MQSIPCPTLCTIGYRVEPLTYFWWFAATFLMAPLTFSFLESSNFFVIEHALNGSFLPLPTHLFKVQSTSIKSVSTKNLPKIPYFFQQLRFISYDRKQAKTSTSSYHLNIFSDAILAASSVLRVGSHCTTRFKSLLIGEWILISLIRKELPIRDQFRV